jgi:hypothetical protein
VLVVLEVVGALQCHSLSSASTAVLVISVCASWFESWERADTPLRHMLGFSPPFLTDGNGEFTIQKKLCSFTDQKK